MESRVEQLRRIPAYYRRRLDEGTDAALLATYLREIAGIEAELRHLESRRPNARTRPGGDKG
jgi:hypothetical protein